MMKKDIAKRMEKILKDLPEPGEASSGQHYNITMFKMSLLMFMTTERIGTLTWVLIALTGVVTALTIVIAIKIVTAYHPIDDIWINGRIRR